MVTVTEWRLPRTAPGRQAAPPSFAAACSTTAEGGLGADRLSRCVPDGGFEGPHPAGVPRHPGPARRRALRPPQDGCPRPPARLLAGADTRRRRLRSVLRACSARSASEPMPTTLARAARVNRVAGGRRRRPTRTPRPATRGEISDPRPATPSDPGRTVRPGHCQMPGAARNIVSIGILKLFFGCNTSK